MSFLNEISRFIPCERIYTDELRRLAWGTDAGCYRLTPKIVVRAANETEVSRMLAVADRLKVAVTFRAAGTSLSGQAISDSVLIVAGKNWEKYTLAADASVIKLQPGIIGERVNELLRPHGRKFSPDPASVKSAMVGGIIMNNASGMNCGVHANSDRVLLSARMIFADGYILDTGEADSRARFMRDKPAFVREIENIRDQIRANPTLVERIRRKYAIKNVTGLNILPFVRYDDPFDIIAHLLVGSEGTLAFLAEAVMQTEYDFPFKASAMLYFADIREACRAVVAMKQLVGDNGEPIVKGAELLDKKSLQSVNDPMLATVDSASGSGLTAVLTETKAATQQTLEVYISRITDALQGFGLCAPVYFTDKPDEYSRYWAIRSGIFPSVGGTRRPGTTTLIEDVAFHIDDLPEATADLQLLMLKHHYDDACIYGHALEGNYHFIINQSFGSESEIKRYEALMNDVIHLVVDKYEGSLKAEHGTGRNMAPFVEYEWGSEAYKVMKAVKRLFDPQNLLNPGVIFNDDLHCHLRNFKALPTVHPSVDKCIECGFCEVNCLTCGLTLSSRQRIVVQREIANLKAKLTYPEVPGAYPEVPGAYPEVPGTFPKVPGTFPEVPDEYTKAVRKAAKRRLRALNRQYRYAGNQTCAGDGLCAMSCPMSINVGDLTHHVRHEACPPSSIGYVVGLFVANHFSLIKNMLRSTLSLANVARSTLGVRAMRVVARCLHRYCRLPLWTSAMPRGYRYRNAPDKQKDTPLRVVYFPSCINQTMGLEKNAPETQPLVDKMLSLLRKADYEVIFPSNMKNLCCGTIWESKGMVDIADRKAAELGAALCEASEGGRYPVLCDQSPCLYRMRHVIKGVKLYEPVEFISLFLLDRLKFTPTDAPVAIHVTCSMRKMGLDKMVLDLAKRCSTQAFVPDEIGCCGFAGDKGFTHPEVNAYALRKLRPQIERRDAAKGYSNSRTCEIGLTTNAGIPYHSIAYLVDDCTERNDMIEPVT